MEDIATDPTIVWKQLSRRVHREGEISRGPHHPTDNPSGTWRMHPELCADSGIVHPHLIRLLPKIRDMSMDVIKSTRRLVRLSRRLERLPARCTPPGYSASVDLTAVRAHLQAAFQALDDCDESLYSILCDVVPCHAMFCLDESSDEEPIKLPSLWMDELVDQGGAAGGEAEAAAMQAERLSLLRSGGSREHLAEPNSLSPRSCSDID